MAPMALFSIGRKPVVSKKSSQAFLKYGQSFGHLGIMRYNLLRTKFNNGFIETIHSKRGSGGAEEEHRHYPAALPFWCSARKEHSPGL
jgi:hypothetical protein